MAIRRRSPIHKKAVVLILAISVFCPFVSAQKALKLPTVEVFGGYSHLRFESTTLGFSDQLNLNGWNVGLSLPDLYEGFGVAVDISGHYAPAMEEYNFLIGPQYSYKWKGLGPYAHALFGKARDRLRQPGSTQLEPSSLGRAIALGGGLDFQLSDRFSVRAIQADYLTTSVFSGTQHNIRLSTGVIFRFGKH
jgi:hypothetical protein